MEKQIKERSDVGEERKRRNEKLPKIEGNLEEHEHANEEQR